MREFRFRGWDFKNEYMYYTYNAEEAYFVIEENKLKLKVHDFENKQEIMQYIGISDINNKPIYEGDIVRTKWQHCGITNYEYILTGEIKYITEYMAFRLHYNIVSWVLHDFCQEKLLSIEIIGNIYENPNLLEKLHKNEDK